MTLLLDTHALLWSAVAPEQLSAGAARAISEADELAVAAMTWWELAWMVRRGRVTPRGSSTSWFAALQRDVRTIPITPAIALAAASLAAFPSDPGDRLIYATAVDRGWRLVTKDGRMRAHDREGAVVVW